MSTLRLIDGVSTPDHRLGSPPPAPPLPPPPSGVPNPPPHAAPVITSNPRPQRTIRMRASYTRAVALASLLLVAPPTRAGESHARGATLRRRHDLDRRHQRSRTATSRRSPRFGGYVANLRRGAGRATAAASCCVDARRHVPGTLESNMTEGAAVVARLQRARVRRRRDRQPRVRLRAGRARDLAARAGRRSARRAQGARRRGPLPVPGREPRRRRDRRAARLAQLRAARTIVDVARHQGRHRRPRKRRHRRSSTLPANFAGLRALAPRAAVIAAAKDLRRRGAAIVVVVAHVGGSCKRLGSPDDLSSCEADSEIFQLARALPAGHGRRDRRRPHARRDRPPRRRHPDHRGLRQGARPSGASTSICRHRAHSPRILGEHDLRPEAIASREPAVRIATRAPPPGSDPAVAAAIAPALAAAREAARREAGRHHRPRPSRPRTPPNRRSETCSPT